ncbi:hypothetical protein [Fructobacillus fructosus]|uniref:Uncharacterized protein n=1 Tax=Fructobacillus fructosus TaxID=1631 RepID=A0ABM9MSI5_9LACO|nr:hypothetical protein [Fructobacillus fructosus]MBD9365583.1 hypothetical protein [Leuconostoc mesenteroides]KRN53168.1 hypothetical protein IV71_GL000727 [Fructobacillus fructosus KCTC 3544]MBC9118919.1 hypothetical protein [Fructobacillus fructosus]MCK8638285.1 hypothetical protein [Fructobacillus fructosus]CAK1225950.1 unnamed protein product [Fructobacillus fructosus]
MAFERIKQKIEHLQEINQLRKKAQQQADVLKADLQANQQDIEDIKRDVARYNFKNAAPLARINDKLSKYKG